MDKQVNGLSEIQKDVLTGMYLEKDNKQICEEMGISAATVRSHKFNLQNRNEAKILLALLEQIENETIVKQRKKTEQEALSIEELLVKRISAATHCILSLRSII